MSNYLTMSREELDREFGKVRSEYERLRAVSYTHLTLPTICSV